MECRKGWLQKQPGKVRIGSRNIPNAPSFLGHFGVRAGPANFPGGVPGSLFL